MRNPVVAYVTICANCQLEHYFPKQGDANSARKLHKQTQPGHAVRVTRVRTLDRPPRRQSA